MAKAVVDPLPPGRPGATAPAAAPGVLEPDSARAIRSLVVRLAWPSILENLLQSVFNILMIKMVAALGAAAIAGVGASNSLNMVAMSSFFALSMGTTVLVAHATGAKNPEAASRAAKQSLSYGVILGSVITVLGVIFAPQALAALGAGPEVVADGSAYLRAFSLGGVFIVTTFIAGGVMRGAGDARTPMLVTFASLAVSLILAYPLIFGVWGLPRLGVVGAGFATTVARGGGCLILLFLLGRPGRAVSLAGREGWVPSLAPLRRLLSIGLPSMFESLFRAGGMLFFAVIVFRLGTTVAAAQQVVQQIVFFSMMPGFGFSMAATTLVGQGLGANNPTRARASSMFATRSCLTWMGTMGAVFFLGGDWIMRFFSTDPEIISQGAAALKVVALSQPGQAIGMVLAGSLRGAGDTRYPMFTTGAAMWLVRLPFAYLFGITLGFGLSGVYLGWVIDSCFTATLNWVRYRTGRWQQRRVKVE